MELPIKVNGKEYQITRWLEINNKDYLTYEDDENIYINQYEVENGNLKLLEVEETEKKVIIKEFERNYGKI